MSLRPSTKVFICYKKRLENEEVGIKVFQQTPMPRQLRKSLIRARTDLRRGSTTVTFPEELNGNIRIGGLTDLYLSAFLESNVKEVTHAVGPRFAALAQANNSACSRFGVTYLAQQGSPRLWPGGTAL
jgi:hypothetical protein